METFRDMLIDVARLPSMYVGSVSLKHVMHYLDGYEHAMMNAANCAPEDTPLYGWQRWIELRFMISHTNWGWTRILLHIYGSDRAAFDVLPALYDDFVKQRSAIGTAGIDAEAKQKFIKMYGEEWHCPESTDTA